MNERDVGKLTDHVSLGALTRIVPRYVVDEVLAQTGRREKRSRALPAHVVVYFVLALALFTDGYEEVIRKLVNGLRFSRTWSREWTVPTSGTATASNRACSGPAPSRARACDSAPLVGTVHSRLQVRENRSPFTNLRITSS